jgi:SAM-dependent methyltransferase
VTSTDAKCILCGGEANKVRNWTWENIKETYGRLSEKPIPEEIPKINYTIMKCAMCSLLFAEPQIPGNSAFYWWIAAVPNYYQEFRWEWGRVLAAIASHPKKRMLEVGCGSGNFLQYASERLNADVTGLDTNPEAVAKAKERGLRAHCWNLEQYILENPSIKFDVICAYHCLEHVPDPKQFVKLMQRILVPGGWLALSVPYSPTSWEVFEWDCLNLPPHHLTRWNKASLERLAFEVGMDAEIESSEGGLPGPLSVKPLVWKFLSLTGGSGAGVSGYLRPILHPVRFMRLALFALSRERVASKPAGDTALAILRFRPAFATVVSSTGWPIEVTDDPRPLRAGG